MKAWAPSPVRVTGMPFRAIGLPPPRMLTPARPRAAKGTWDRMLTTPVSLALLETSTYRVPTPPLILTVGLLTLRSSS